ncbi:hypothetical protein, partial [Chthonomonas calidirosea]|uniref:hypothetical protein n=1 Tax=Chthonomonas calidirosea TaxID=454171 RepID=UPI001E339B0A
GSPLQNHHTPIVGAGPCACPFGIPCLPMSPTICLKQDDCGKSHWATTGGRPYKTTTRQL